MTTVTLTRGGTSVDIQLWRDGSGQLAFARDVGKPYQTIHKASTLHPLHGDNLSAGETWTLLGVLEGNSAYADAKTLAETLVRPKVEANPLTLDATQLSGIDSEVEVGVPTPDALRLSYDSGVHDLVDLQLSVPLVDRTVG